ncbi:hypothetical protein ACP4OV_015070 [Aristida adscensionis]
MAASSLISPPPSSFHPVPRTLASSAAPSSPDDTTPDRRSCLRGRHPHIRACVQVKARTAESRAHFTSRSKGQLVLKCIIEIVAGTYIQAVANDIVSVNMDPPKMKSFKEIKVEKAQ